MTTNDFSKIMNNLSKDTFTEPAVDCDWDAFKKVLTSRRSVRIFEKSPVPEAVIKSAIDSALIAPTSSNLQQTEFYWVRTADKKKKLVQYCLGQPAAATAQELVVVVARTDTWRRNARGVLYEMKKMNAPKGVIKYYEQLVPLAYGAGPLGLLNVFKRIYFLIKGFTGVTPREPKSYGDLRVWAHKSAALAAENFMLAIRAQGFDSCPMEGHDSLRVRKLLGLPRGAEINMVVGVGLRAPSGVYGPRFRLPRELFVFEV